MWTTLKASVLVALVASSGSTCRGQSENGTAPTKDAPAAAREVSLPGIDTSALTPREKNEWSGYVSELLAPCSDTPVSIAQCIKENRPCSRCMPAAKYLLKGVRDGQSREQVEKSFQNRFDPKKIRDVAIEGSPSKGPESAPVVVVEFADFECPFCASMAPVFDKAWEERKDKVRFIFKFMPLPSHPHGEIAARAGYAASQQGKFWELNKKMFANRDHLEQSDLESYAKDLGLDLAKFKADMQSQGATDRLNTDRKLADALGVKGTPTVYINGREFDVRQDMGDWINLELAMMAESGKPTTTTASTTSGAAPSAAPSAGAAPSASAKPAPAVRDGAPASSRGNSVGLGELHTVKPGQPIPPPKTK